MSATFDLHALNDELIPAPPPLGNELGVCEGAPHAIARRVEDALHTDFAIAGRGERRLFGCGHHDQSPLVRSRNSSSRLKRASSISSCFASHAASLVKRRGPSMQCPPGQPSLFEQVPRLPAPARASSFRS